jgi:hypothetical protein
VLTQPVATPNLIFGRLNEFNLLYSKPTLPRERRKKPVLLPIERNLSNYLSLHKADTTAKIAKLHATRHLEKRMKRPSPKIIE